MKNKAKDFNQTHKVNNFDIKITVVESILNVKFMDWQKDMIQKMLNGYIVQYGRGCGRTLIRDAYLLMLAMEEDCIDG